MAARMGVIFRMQRGRGSAWRSAIVALAWVSSAAQAALAETREARNPLVAEALFHFLKDDPFQAASRLIVAAHFNRLDTRMSEDALLQGVVYVSYGLPAEAEQVFERLTGEGMAPGVRDQAWFHLGKLYHRRGEFDKAHAAFRRIAGVLAGELEEERRVRHAYVLIARNEPADAIKMLEKLPSTSAWAAYGRYNLGVAFVRTNERKRGLAMLEQLGAQSVAGNEMLALKDKANVAAAYSLLQASEPDRARQLLARVRLDGMLADKALLGMGWAYSNEQQYERALVYWQELVRRDLAGAEVQEALLAIPYALDKLGARRQALTQYEEALAKYGDALARIGAAVDEVRSGRFVKGVLAQSAKQGRARVPLEQLPDSRARPFLGRLAATHVFQDAIGNHRDLLSLQDNMNNVPARLTALGPARTSGDLKTEGIAPMSARETTLRARIREALDAEVRAIERLALAELAQRQERLTGYQAQARFAIADLTDRLDR